MRLRVLALVSVLGVTAALAKNGPSGSVQPSLSNTSVDGEQAYRSNCTRCHTAPPTLSPRQANTVMRHMRVKANLPARDAEAVYQYLLQSDEKH